MTDDWTPEKEEEDDPIKLQKEQLAMGREFLKKIREQEEEKKRREAECAAPPPGRFLGVYKPPTFEEVSAALKKAWDETERIMPTADDRVKAMAFQSLMHAAAPAPSIRAIEE